MSHSQETQPLCSIKIFLIVYSFAHPDYSPVCDLRYNDVSKDPSCQKWAGSPQLNYRGLETILESSSLSCFILDMWTKVMHNTQVFHSIRVYQVPCPHVETWETRNL